MAWKLVVLIERHCEGDSECEVDVLDKFRNGELWLTQENIYRIGEGE